MINSRALKSMMIAFVLLVLNACYYDVQQELHPQGEAAASCDTSDISYSGRVTTILRTSCYGCHSLGVSSGGVRLDDYQSVKAVADNGRLTGSIDHLPGFVPMPQNLPQLSECDRTIIKKWIQNGTTNN